MAPRERRLVSRPAPVMMWSCSVTPRALQAFWTSFVIARSAAEGSGSPDGWLWITRRILVSIGKYSSFLLVGENWGRFLGAKCQAAPDPVIVDPLSSCG